MARLIRLTKGYSTIVDDDDYLTLIHMGKWGVSNIKKDIKYAKKRDCKTDQTILMHRAILKPKKHEHIDHANRDGLDNRKCNLRICSIRENRQNSRTSNRKGKTSKYKGIGFRKKIQKWIARITFNGKPIYLGYYNSETEAAHAYDKAALKYFGEFARPNFTD